MEFVFILKLDGTNDLFVKQLFPSALWYKHSLIQGLNNNNIKLRNKNGLIIEKKGINLF